MKDAIKEIDVIYHESCLETLKRLPDNSIDAVITSPPYNMNLRIRNGEYCSRQIVKELSTKYDGFPDNIPIEEYYSFHKEVIGELLRVSDIIFYNIQIVTGSKRAFFKIIGDFAENIKEIIVWDKGNAQPAMASRVLNRQSELILVLQKNGAISRQFEKCNFERGTLSDVWLVKRENRRGKNSYHGATFPEALIHKILTNFTNRGDIVYDPFMGTGTTACVAKKLGRHYIGSEIVENYINICKERLQSCEIPLI